MNPIEDVVRSIVIRASRDAVFRFFTDSERWASWWGAGSTIDPRPGGSVQIVYPNNARASGAVREIVPGERIVFTYGYEGEGKPIPPGGSTVIVTLADHPDGTQVTLRHTGLPDVKTAKEHVQGWRFQLSLFSKAASRYDLVSVHERVDQWLSLWGEADAGKRALNLRAATPDVTFHDEWSALFGAADVDAHVAAAAIHMPGVRIVRVGDAALSHGSALVAWESRAGEKVAAQGRNFFDFAPDGRIRRVVGFWGA